MIPAPTVLPARHDLWLVTVAEGETGLPQRVCEVFALRLGRRGVDDVEVLSEFGVWWTVRPGQQLRVEEDRSHAAIWPPLGGWPRPVAGPAAERDAT
jgi:hypothetical protein